ncbi:dolichyldiphosphatase [Sarracenia purpurea var. burkii]
MLLRWFVVKDSKFGLYDGYYRSKWLVTAALFVVVFLWRRDAKALWTATGSNVNSGMSVILKKVLNQGRPVSRKSSGPGMPSSHAQSIFFTVTFAATSCKILARPITSIINLT